MAADWHTANFGSLLAEPIRNGIYKPKEFQGRGAKIVNMGELFRHPRLRAVPMRRVEISASERKRVLLAVGDLLFARRSLVAEGAGKCSVVLDIDEPTTFESSIIRARPNRDQADPLFLYYFFSSAAGMHRLDTIRRHVAVAGITGTDLSRLEVPVPPLREQQAVARILGTLDDKIELNQRMNETLEAMARALFRSWFVDFEPVRANAVGRDPGLAQPIAELFPGRFEESELGEIPSGWSAGKVSDVLGELVSGGRPKGGAIKDGVPSVGAENVLGLGRYDFSKEKFVPPEFFELLKEKGAALRPGDVLLYKDGAQIGRKTYFDRGFPHAECAINEHVFILRAIEQAMQRYLFLWLDQAWVTNEIVALNSNSAQPGINQAGVRALPLLIPPHPVVEEFDRRTQPLTDRIFVNCLESRALGALRDALLPKLMSGGLRVPRAERMLEAAPA